MILRYIKNIYKKRRNWDHIAVLGVVNSLLYFFYIIEDDIFDLTILFIIFDVYVFEFYGLTDKLTAFDFFLNNNDP